jgi:hypothetical protein
MSEGGATQVLAGEATWSLFHGDCLGMLRGLPDCCVDLVVTDPPYGLSEHPQKSIVEALTCWLAEKPYLHKKAGFMGAHWDAFVPGPEVWREVFRVMKPGAHAAVFAGTRTIDLMGIALRLAGFEIRDTPFTAIGAGLCGAWVQGQGFAKSVRADRAVSMERCELPGQHCESTLPKPEKRKPGDHICPDHPDGEAWRGFGTALAPKYEPILMVRKPLDGTIGQNVLRHGCGTLNIDGTRVAHGSPADLAAHQAQVAAIKSRGGSMDNSWKNSSDLSGASDVNTAGRWPPNFLLVHDARCRKVGTQTVAANPTWDTPNRDTEPSAFTGERVSKVRHANGRDGEASADKRYATDGATAFAMLPGQRRDEQESVDVYECVDCCPVRSLATQSGEGKVNGSIGAAAGARVRQNSIYGTDAGMRGEFTSHGDTGTAARYFPQLEWDPELDDISPFVYSAKASRAERDRGLNQFRERSGGEATEREDESISLASPRSGAGRGGGIRNNQPTIKPIRLIQRLVRTVRPPQLGEQAPLMLVPFGGAGSEIVAGLLEGCRVVSAEINDTDDKPFVSIARGRIHWVEGREFTPRESLRTAEPPAQVAMFSFDGTQGAGS